MNELPGAPAALPSRRFSVVGKLGEGGMGAVYEVVDQERQAHMALKTLRQLGPEWVERLKHEFRSLQDLHHPNLVTLGELVEESGRWYFTMELVRGCNLLQYVRPDAPAPTGVTGAFFTQSERRSQPQSAEEVQTQALASSTTSEAHSPSASEEEHTQALAPAGEREVQPQAVLGAPLAPQEAPNFNEERLRSGLAQLARGLHALHRAGKVHRDIKPSNILVTETGRVVLLDFGVLADVQQDGAWEGAVVGTASYMAPDQADGGPTSPQADWYSVGVLLYECLTGYRPFTGNPRDIMYAKRRLDPVPPQARVAGLPEDLCRLCLELLNRNPAQRPSGEEVLWRLGAQEEAAAEWYLATLPFVGRQRELAVLHEALADSRRGKSVVMLVEGEPGVGKSRLVRHFVEAVRQQVPGAVVLSGRCYERESVPYKGAEGLVADLARHLRRLGEAALPALRPAEIGALAQLFPVLQQVPGLLESAPAAAPAQDLAQVHAAAGRALHELLGRLAANTPVVLAVDDLQWADHQGFELLDEVLRAPGLLLVATLRVSTSEETSADTLEQEARLLRSARWLPLEGLSDQEVRDLVERLLGTSLPPEQAHRIAAESGGQPLFVDVLVHHYCRGGGPLPQALVIEDALWARIWALEPQARLLLELLAVAKGPLAQAVAARAAELEFPEYARLAAALRSSHVALTTGPSGQDTLVLVHERVRRAVLQHLDEADRSSRHARLAASLEALGQGDNETLAYHWHRAEQPERAVSYYLCAAEQAGTARAFSRQATLYATALGLARYEPAEQRRLQAARARALASAGRGADAATLFLEAAQGAPEAEAHLLRRQAAEQCLASGRIQEGLELLRQVLAEVGLPCPRSSQAALAELRWQRLQNGLGSLRPRPRPDEQSSQALLRQVDACWGACTSLSGVAPLEALSFASRHLRLALALGEPQRVLYALLTEALLLAAEHPRRRPRLEQLLAQIEPLAAQHSEDLLAQSLLGLVRMAGAWCTGQLPRIRVHLELVLHYLPELAGAFWLKVLVWSMWAEAEALVGNLAEMQRQLSQPVVEASERGDLVGQTLLQLGYPSLGWLAQGEPREARRLADELIARWPCERFLLPHLVHLQALGYIDLYEGRGAAVLRRLEEHALELHRLAGRLSSLRCMLGDLRSRALLQEAMGLRGSKGRARLAQVEAEARSLEREGKTFTQPQATLLRAGVALRRNQPERALAAYARAAEQAEGTGMRLLAAAARWRHAELQGGEEGRTRLQEIHRWMREQGLLFPEHMVALLAPSDA